MYLLDTDVVSKVFSGQPEFKRLADRVREEWGNLCISAITLEEQIKDGAFPLINEAHRQQKSPAYAYDFLHRVISSLAKYQYVPYDDAAEQVFRGMDARLRQRYPNDCRIAAIAISRGYTVVTRNQKDFRAIPGVKLDDWDLLDPDDIPPPAWAV